MHGPAICTIVAKNYLAHARCLTESFLAQHPDGRVFVLLADTCDGYFDPAAERFTTIEARDLGIPEFEQMAFRYTVVEFNTAVKPFLLEHLFEKYELESLCYFDPDIYFYQPITHIYDLLATNRVVLTPHLLAPLDDDRMPDEPYILRAGVYNLGFIGLSRGPELGVLLRWWQQRLVKDCVVDAARGLFVDQRWVDLVPGFFDDVAILRDPGYNAAYWNLKHRDIRCRDGQWRANGSPLVFYHFSGLPMSDITAISKHQDRYTLESRPELAPLFSAYRDRLLANGYETVRRWPYAYGAFDGGVAIPDAARHLWRNLEGETRWPRPFCAAEPNSFLDWLNREVHSGVKRGALISNLAMEIYRQRWDLQEAFPDVLNSHREHYARWFAESAEKQHHLDPLFVRPVKESLGTLQSAPTNASSSPQSAPPVNSSNGQQPSRRLSLYQALRQPLRKTGLNAPLKRLLGPKTTHAIYTVLTSPRARQPIIEAPLVGTPTLRRRFYYVVRNPLRRMGLHTLARSLLGERRVVQIYARMVEQHNLPPEAKTRLYGSPARTSGILPSLPRSTQSVTINGQAPLAPGKHVIAKDDATLARERELAEMVRVRLREFPPDAPVVLSVRPDASPRTDRIVTWLETLPADTPVLLIDDGDDNAESVDQRLVGNTRVVYVRKPTRTGWIDTLNLAFEWCAPRDIALLGAEVVTPPDWLARLRAAAYARSTIATATAFANVGGYLSIPNRNQPARALPTGMNVDEADARLRHATRLIRPIVPTPLQHCVYFKRMALNVVGPLDTDYTTPLGALADFAQRGVAVGLSHVVADDLLVFYDGQPGEQIDSSTTQQGVSADDRLLAARYHWYPDWLARTARATSGPFAEALDRASRSLIGERIAIDATCLDGTITGTQIGTLGLIDAIAAAPERFGHLTLIVADKCPSNLLNDLSSRVQQVVRVGEVAAQAAPMFDLVHRPFQVASIAHVQQLQHIARRIVVSQLDCIAFSNPSYAPDIVSWNHLRQATELLFQVADGIVFNSHDVLDDAAHLGLRIAPERALIGYNGVEHYYERAIAARPPLQGQTLEGLPFILMIGTNYRHKNRVYALRLLAELIRAYDWPGKLVFAGPSVRGGSQHEEAVELQRRPELAAHVHDLGPIDEAEKQWLLERSALVLYPSLYEGFGFVPFEAAAAGKPALSLRMTALDEVLGGDVAYLGATDMAADAQLVWSLLTDAEAARRQIEAINTRASAFKWSEIATRMWHFYRQILDQPSRQHADLPGSIRS